MKYFLHKVLNHLLVRDSWFFFFFFFLGFFGVFFVVVAVVFFADCHATSRL